jgi:hypothetical protein
MARPTSAEHKELMGVLERIAKALESLAFPLYSVTFDTVKDVAEPVWPPRQPPYYVGDPLPGSPFDYHTGDPLPRQRPENIC